MEVNENVSAAGEDPAKLSKEEMRQKIRASLAAKEAAEYGAESPGASRQEVRGQKERAKMQKVRQIHENMEQRQKSMSFAAAAAAPGRTASSGGARVDMNARGDAPDAGARPERDVLANEKIWRRAFLIIFGVLVLGLGLLYFGGMFLYRGRFLPNTYVNGIALSGMTKEEAESAIVDSVQDMGITFYTKDGEQIAFSGVSFGCKTFIADDALDEAYNESHALWFRKLFEESDYTVHVSQTYSEDALASLIAAYDWGDTPPTDAQVLQADDGSFYIEPENDGDMIDTQILSSYTLEQLGQGNTSISLVMAGCYLKAEVRAEDLEDQLDLYNKYASLVITYDMTNREALFDPVGKVELTFDTFKDWISFDTDGTLSLDDRDAATAWVQENIADPYDTFGNGYTRSFDSTVSGIVTLTLTTTSTYGWQTDVDATVTVMEQYLQAGESVSVEPEWASDGAEGWRVGFRPRRDDGTVFEEGTYIEIDISSQHLWFYVNGDLYLESDVVTGLATDPDRQTHTGVFKIRYKAEDVVLGTYEEQGYEAHVNYWMPIDFTGIGLHDLNRSAYGGDIYTYNGSHGCINLPYNVAQSIYEECVVGMPVIIVD